MYNLLGRGLMSEDKTTNFRCVTDPLKYVDADVLANIDKDMVDIRKKGGIVPKDTLCRDESSMNDGPIAVMPINSVGTINTSYVIGEIGPDANLWTKPKTDKQKLEALLKSFGEDFVVHEDDKGCYIVNSDRDAYFRFDTDGKYVCMGSE